MGATANLSNIGYSVAQPYQPFPPNGSTNFSVESQSDYDEYIYEYDYDESVNTLPLGELIPVAIVYGLTLMLGVIGNALVIFSILRYRRMQTVTNIFLTSLASADLILVLLCVPIKFAKWFTFTWQFGEVLCKMVHYLQNVSVICSVLTLTGMSIERYYAILHPMRAKFLCTVHRAKRAIFIIWVLSFILALPILFGQIHKEVGVQRKAYWCVKEWINPVYDQTYEIGMLLLIFVFPLFVISFAYINICIELWVMTSRRATMRATGVRHVDEYEHEMSYVNHNAKMSRGPIRLHRRRKPCSDDDRTRKQVIKMLVTVIILFALCWGPTLIDNVLVSFEHVDRYHYGHLKYLRMAFVLMSYFNSCVNPIVYAFMSKNFRESFKHAIYSCLPGGTFIINQKKNRQVSFQTRTSSITLSRGVSIKNDIDPDACDSQWTDYRLLGDGSCESGGEHDNDNDDIYNEEAAV